MRTLKPETGKNVLVNFFHGILDNIEALPLNKLSVMENAPVFTDLQLKQLFIPQDGKHYYCLNFALICEKEDLRSQALFLVKIITDQFLSRSSEGIQNTEKKLRAYLGKEKIV